MTPQQDLLMWIIEIAVAVVFGGTFAGYKITGIFKKRKKNENTKLIDDCKDQITKLSCEKQTLIAKISASDDNKAIKEWLKRIVDIDVAVNHLRETIKEIKQKD